MESESKSVTIIVTGSNKGIGYGIVEGLCQQEEIPQVIMACRNEERANTAKKQLEAQYPKANGKLVVGILDVGDFKSCDNFSQWVKDNFGQVDCLVNNAGIAINPEKNNESDARKTSQVNYFGTAYLSKKMLPLIVDNGKIICLTSQAGLLTRLSQDFQNKLLDPKVNEEIINKIAEEFFVSYRNETTVSMGFRDSMYGMSKVFINCFLKFWAQTEEVLKRGIQVYSLCPGYVNTDMTHGNGKRTLAEGAKTPLYLIDLPYELDKEKQGLFFFDEKPRSLI